MYVLISCRSFSRDFGLSVPSCLDYTATGLAATYYPATDSAAQAGLAESYGSFVQDVFGAAAAAHLLVGKTLCATETHNITFPKSSRRTAPKQQTCVPRAFYHPAIHQQASACARTRKHTRTLPCTNARARTVFFGRVITAF